MSRFDDTDTPHLRELAEFAGMTVRDTDPDDCTYCTRAFSKGFHTCPECGTLQPVDWEGE